ncbi:MAG: hypothetical protein ACR2NP_02930 [Pirellulaceae bacterium]
MQRFFLFAALAAAMISPGIVNAQGNLNSFFKNGSAPQTQQQQQQAPQDGRIDIQRILSSKGFTIVEVRDDGSVEISVERDDITYPALVGMTQSGNKMWIDIGLSTVPGTAGDHAEKILELLELSGSFGSQFFSYSKENRLIHLIDAMDARLITDDAVAEMVNNAILVAAETVSNWDTSSWTNARHVGSWSAPMGQGTMVISLRADGSFEMINRAGSEVMTITGNYQLDRGTLQMQDAQGNEINGALQFVDGNHFNLVVNNQNLSVERS